MDYTLIKDKSLIYGTGIFSKNEISKGKVFYEVPMNHTSCQLHDHHAYIGNGKFVSDEEILNSVNHSCNPNTILDISKRPPVLVAKKNIRPNEEITCDYDETEVDGIKFRCKCNSNCCRVHIGKVV